MNTVTSCCLCLSCREKFKEDYEKVQKKLRELPDHLSYDYMVSFTCYE